MNQRITETDLVTTLRVRVRFSEMDALRMVWHGNYVTYLEDARERWAKNTVSPIWRCTETAL